MVYFRFGNQNSPHWSCDLILLDFFLRGYLKSTIYAKKSTTTTILKKENQLCVNEIKPYLCEMLMVDFDEEVHMRQQSHTGQLADLLFHP